MKEYYLGLSLSHDCTATLVDEFGNVIVALAEERLTRKKNQLGFPYNALNAICKKYSNEIKLLKKVIVGSHSVFMPGNANYFKYIFGPGAHLDLYENDLANLVESAEINFETSEQVEQYVKASIEKLLNGFNINAEVLFVKHHDAHAASACLGSGFKSALCVTADGEGDYESVTVSEFKNGRIQRLNAVDNFHSLGSLYSYVTKYCGFKMGRHEGKITGLAACGNPKIAYNYFAKHINIGEPPTISLFCSNEMTKIKFDNKYEKIVNFAPVSSFADLAAGIQLALEMKLCEFISYWLSQTNSTNLVLSGGVFANVKLNQRILDTNEISRIYIDPNMGDGGLAYGSCAYHLLNSTKKSNFAKIDSVYLGLQFSNTEVKEAISALIDPREYKIQYIPGLIPIETAKRLADEKVVGWFQGRMEYGPRALGNRSILANPKNKDINSTLNKRMNRTEFMPFAPVCKIENGPVCFELKSDAVNLPAKFMTITLPVKEEWISKMPAVVHVDGTARPQFVSREGNEKYYQLLDEFESITGIPALVNTSFNIHEEPIVCAPDEAIAALLGNVIDVLVIEDYIVEKM